MHENGLLRNYPRMVTPKTKKFDPVLLAKVTEKIICRWKEGQCERKYDDFYATGVYGGIATGYAVGCCLRCIFCWSYPSRDFPESYGTYYSPVDVHEKLKNVAKKANVRKCRLSSCEPTLCKDHLLALLELVEDDPWFKLFILETNGILFGSDKDYVRQLTRFSKVYVRISLKAGTPEQFSRKTGSIPEAFELPFNAIKYLMECEIPFHVAAMSLDPRIMDPEERAALVKKLADIDIGILLNLEEEIVDPYDMTIARLRAAGIKLKWPIKKIYTPIRDLIAKKL